MTRRLLHTPEGVRDVFGNEFDSKCAIQNGVDKVLKKYGYRGIQTPILEYFEVFNKEKSTASSKNLYKFFDRDGNTLVLRPDITPSIARACATVMENEALPLRLRYMGSTFYNHSSYRGELKETTVVGAELLGDDSVEADAEMIAMAVECLDHIGMSEFQISIGMNEFFQSVVEETSLDEDSVEELRTLIINKNTFGVKRLVEEKNVTPLFKTVFLRIPTLFGGSEVLKTAYHLSVNQRGIDAIERLMKLNELLKLYHVEDKVTFDLSMLGSYEYYTGVTFRAYTLGSGDAVVKGGRYDNLIGKFGRETQAVGFVCDIDELLGALAHQKKAPQRVEKISAVLYNVDDTYSAIQLANQLRSQGQNVALFAYHDEDEFFRLEDKAVAEKVDYLLVLREEGKVDFTEIATNGSRTYSLSSFFAKGDK
ncbi:MAG: ATP phosphoribosyltransferase regulatory subunit [Clostridiales bacterium]|nr:ATP phosphoribosyltransferase regulatory subunit [Clostridiales bacterium]